MAGGDPKKRFERAMDRLYSAKRASSALYRGTPDARLVSDSPSSSSREKDANPSAATSLLHKYSSAGTPYDIRTPSPRSRPVCRPWDRGDVLRRLATFKSMTWFGKPQVAGPVACARRGWINVDVDLLACEFCGAHLCFVLPPPPWNKAQVDTAGENFAEKLDSGHKSLCSWKGNACSESLALFPPTPLGALVDGFYDRCRVLLQLSALPIISGSAIDTFKRLQGSEIESVLAQPFPPLANGFRYIQERQAGGVESADKSENNLSFERFFQAQRLIALCGWEPRVLPYTVDSVDGPTPALKFSKSGELLSCDAVVSKNFQSPGPSVMMVAKSPKVGELSEAVPDDEMQFDPASAVLECRLCRASVGLWGFSSISRPPLLKGAAAAAAAVGGDVAEPTTPRGENGTLDDGRIGGASAASAVEGGGSRRRGDAAGNNVEVGETGGGGGGEDAPETPTRVIRSPAPGVLNLSLTIAGGPPPTQLSSPAMIPPAFGPIPGFLPRLGGQAEGSEVGGDLVVASYESRESRDQDYGGPQFGGGGGGSSAVDTVSDRQRPTGSNVEGTVLDRNMDDVSLNWRRRSTGNSTVDQTSQGAGAGADIITAEVDTHVDSHVRGMQANKRRKTNASSAQGAGGGTSTAHFARHGGGGAQDLLPCSSSVNAVDTHYLHKQENSMESVENQFQDSDGHEATAVSAENEVNDLLEGTETVGQIVRSGTRGGEAASSRSVQQNFEPASSKSDEVEFADDGVDTNVGVISTGTGAAGGGGASVGMMGGSLGTQASHDIEMQGEVNGGADCSEQRTGITTKADAVPEVVVEFQGLMGDSESAPGKELMGDSIPRIEEEAGPSDVRGDSQDVILDPDNQQQQQDHQHLSMKESVQSESGKRKGKKRVKYDDEDDLTVDTTKAVLYFGDSGQQKEATDGHTVAGGDEEGCTTVTGPRRGLEELRIWDTEKGEFDPIRQHRHFCPWVNGNAAVAASSSPGGGTCGWQLTLHSLRSHHQQGDRAAHLDKSESTKSVFKASSLGSGRRLMGLSPSQIRGRRLSLN